jgi:hypothetical protein
MLRPLGAASRGFLMALALAGAAPAFAMDLSTYDRQRREPEGSAVQSRLRIYLLGIGEGLRLANDALRHQSVPPLFCAPADATALSDDYLRMIDTALRANRGTYERQGLSIETVLLLALQDRYRCGQPVLPPATSASAQVRPVPSEVAAGVIARPAAPASAASN